MFPGRISQGSQHGVDGDCGDKVNSMIENGKLVCVPTKEEIREAIAQLNNNKAPGEKEITQENIVTMG